MSDDSQVNFTTLRSVIDSYKKRKDHLVKREEEVKERLAQLKAAQSARRDETFAINIETRESIVRSTSQVNRTYSPRDQNFAAQGSGELLFHSKYCAYKDSDKSMEGNSVECVIVPKKKSAGKSKFSYKNYAGGNDLESDSEEVLKEKTSTRKHHKKRVPTTDSYAEQREPVRKREKHSKRVREVVVDRVPDSDQSISMGEEYASSRRPVVDKNNASFSGYDVDEARDSTEVVVKQPRHSRRSSNRVTDRQLNKYPMLKALMKDSTVDTPIVPDRKRRKSNTSPTRKAAPRKDSSHDFEAKYDTAGDRRRPVILQRSASGSESMIRIESNTRVANNNLRRVDSCHSSEDEERVRSRAEYRSPDRRSRSPSPSPRERVEERGYKVFVPYSHESRGLRPQSSPIYITAKARSHSPAERLRAPIEERSVVPYPHSSADERPHSRGNYDERPHSRDIYDGRPTSRDNHDGRPTSRDNHNERPHSRDNHDGRSHSRDNHDDRPHSRSNYDERPHSRDNSDDRSDPRPLVLQNKGYGGIVPRSRSQSPAERPAERLNTTGSYKESSRRPTHGHSQQLVHRTKVDRDRNEFDEAYSNNFIMFLVRNQLSRAMSSILLNPNGCVKKPSQEIVASVQEIATIKKLICDELDRREAMGKPFKVRRSEKEHLMKSFVYAKRIHDRLERGFSVREALSVEQANDSESAMRLHERTVRAIRQANRILGGTQPDPAEAGDLETAAAECLRKLGELHMETVSHYPHLKSASAPAPKTCLHHKLADKDICKSCREDWFAGEVTRLKDAILSIEHHLNAHPVKGVPAIINKQVTKPSPRTSSQNSRDSGRVLSPGRSDFKQQRSSVAERTIKVNNYNMPDAVSSNLAKGSSSPHQKMSGNASTVNTLRSSGYKTGVTHRQR